MLIGCVDRSREQAWDKYMESVRETQRSQRNNEFRLLKYEDFSMHYPAYPDIDEVDLDQQQRAQEIDLTPYMNSAALTVHHSTHLNKVIDLFCAVVVALFDLQKYSEN